MTGRYAYHDKIIELYGNHDTWAEVVVERMDEWGFNTLGGWCDADLFDGYVFASTARFFGHRLHQRRQR